MKEKIKILMVEDNPGDIRLTIETIKEGNLGERIELDYVEDGVEALEYLTEAKLKLRNRTFPDIILLDLNLPKKDGREVLKEIKTDPALHTIPVIVLTTSSAEEDIYNAYDLYANCYINKPSGLDEFIRVIRAVEKFWFSTARLPTE